MITADYAANTARAFLTAEIAMASANSEAPIVTRTQAEQLLDLYFGLVDEFSHSLDHKRTSRCP